MNNIVLDRIKTPEQGNRVDADCRPLVDGCDRDDFCSEQDLFLIPQPNMYLACVLRKFVDEVSDKSRWTWQQCIEYSVASMNDIGLETYTHWRPLAKWHRRLAYSQKGTFCKSPAPKTRLPPFFIENPDAMNAFKKHGVSILKELSVERMHTYVLETLIPTMMARIKQGIEEADNSEEEVLLPLQPGAELSQETKDYLQKKN